VEILKSHEKHDYIYSIILSNRDNRIIGDPLVLEAFVYGGVSL